MIKILIQLVSQQVWSMKTVEYRLCSVSLVLNNKKYCYIVNVFQWASFCSFWKKLWHKCHVRFTTMTQDSSVISNDRRGTEGGSAEENREGRWELWRWELTWYASSILKCVRSLARASKVVVFKLSFLSSCFSTKTRDCVTSGASLLLLSRDLCPIAIFLFEKSNKKWCDKTFQL